MGDLFIRGSAPLIGVVHLKALPGAPDCTGLAGVLEAALFDAAALAEGGVDGVIVENFGDAPFYSNRVPPETIASMAVVADRLKGELGGLPLGINVLRNDPGAGLGIAASMGAAFLRINVHVGAMVTDQGLIQGDAARTVRLREQLCPGLPLLCDVHVKHAVPLGGGSIEVAARDTFFRGKAAGLVISGSGTGCSVDTDELVRVREAVPEAPILIGSGLDHSNAASLRGLVDGAIVGTALKRDGQVSQVVDVDRVRDLVRIWGEG